MLDLSALHNIGNQGEAHTSSASAIRGTATPRRTAASGKAAPFTDTTGERDYKRMYRAALDFHSRNYPPVVDAAYRVEHALEGGTPPMEQEYMDREAEDLERTSSDNGHDEFLMSLLFAIHDELFREYERLKKEATSAATVGQGEASSLL